MRLKIYFLTIILAVFIFINVFFVVKSSNSDKNFTKSPEAVFNASQAYIFPISEPSFVPILDTTISRPLIKAKSALVYDTRSGRFLFEQNSRQKLPIASLTKLLSAVIILENLKLEDTVTVPKEALRVDDEKQTLYLGEKISVENLLKLMLIESSNDSAFALALFTQSKGFNFVEKMNERANQLGMADTHFLDPAGLNDEAYSTPYDLIKLVKYALKYDLIWNFLSEKNVVVKSADGKIEHNVKSTDQLLGVLPDIIGGKTGYTDGAGGCMILVVDIPGKNDKIISIVMGSPDRFGDTLSLINWVKSAYRWE